jgi:hypothetical protein
MADHPQEGDPLETRLAAEEEDTRDEVYTGIWERLKGKSQEIVGQARERREEVERLFRELMQAEAAEQLRLVRLPRFQSLALLDWLLEQSHERQLENPEQANQLANLAIRLGSKFGKPTAASLHVEAVAALPRAFCLSANALRLASSVSAADVKLARGSLYLTDGLERALYCRTLALVRWEQARTDEARALLAYAAGSYAREGLEADAALCRGLLGLVLLDVGSADAPAALNQGWQGIDREFRPLVALRVGLALAASLAQAGQEKRARHTLSETWKLYGAVTDAREMDRVFWWEGRALAALGDDDAAIELLGSARRQLIVEPSPAEAALASLDLSMALAEADRSGEIEEVARSLKEAFPAVPLLVLAAEGMAAIREDAANRAVTLRETGVVMEATLRRAFRVFGLQVRPFPVA